MTVQPMRQPQDRQRPRKTARAQQQSAAKRQAEMDNQTFGIRIDGAEYVINPNDITGRVEFEIRRECGMGLAEIITAMEHTQGIDYLGMFMWAVRKSHGEDVDLMEVLDGVSAASGVEEMDAEEIKAAEAPKASGSAS